MDPLLDDVMRRRGDILGISLSDGGCRGNYAGRT